MLSEYIDSLPILNTHEHHSPFDIHKDATLDYLLTNSYIRICRADISDRKRYLDLVCGNSYFVWYEKGLNALFDFGGEITEDYWDSISEKTKAALADPAYHEDVFKNKCKFLRAIQDSCGSPNLDNGRPDLYAPSFRIDCFVYAYNTEAHDHNGNNAQVIYGKCDDFDEYLALIDRTIAEKKTAGCVALKAALAYSRHLDFKPQSKQSAAKIFGKPSHNVAPEEVRTFSNYIFDYVCTLAVKYDLPLQIHTGIARLAGSNPMNLIPMIEKHWETKFVLFHGGYPWTEEFVALSHNFVNVYTDICYLPAVCTSAAERTLHSLIETARDSSRIMWGGDCGIVTESYAYTLAIRYLLNKVLSDKVASGYLTVNRAKRFAERILSVNAQELYKL